MICINYSNLCTLKLTHLCFFNSSFIKRLISELNFTLSPNLTRGAYSEYVGGYFNNYISYHTQGVTYLINAFIFVSGDLWNVLKRKVGAFQSLYNLVYINMAVGVFNKIGKVLLSPVNIFYAISFPTPQHNQNWV